MIPAIIYLVIAVIAWCITSPRKHEFIGDDLVASWDDKSHIFYGKPDLRLWSCVFWPGLVGFSLVKAYKQWRG